MDIIYKPLTMDDSNGFFRLAGDEKVAATMRFDCPETKEESDAILKDYIKKNNRTFAVRSKENEELWGVFAFKGNEDSSKADLSQMLLPSKWGQGLGNKVLFDMVEKAKKEKWYSELEGYILETNTASRKMAEKMGFKEKIHYRFPKMTEDLIVYTLDIK